jgi:hypothetical protein
MTIQKIKSSPWSENFSFFRSLRTKKVRKRFFFPRFAAKFFQVVQLINKQEQLNLDKESLFFRDNSVRKTFVVYACVLDLITLLITQLSVNFCSPLLIESSKSQHNKTSFFPSRLTHLFHFLQRPEDL